jgi:hypothetical protein
MSGTGALLFDGASRKKALVWLSHTYPQHSLMPLLYGTQFELVGDVGPVLIDADEGSPLHAAWVQGASGLKNAVWLKTAINQNQLYASLRRRLRVRSPDGRNFWLRLADARPLLRAWQAEAAWPQGFWHGVSQVWLHAHGGPFLAWENANASDDCCPSAEDMSAQIMLDWPMLEALAQHNDTSQEAEL